jgi:glycosyltransferase involved in cell wall biosynthesis
VSGGLQDLINTIPEGVVDHIIVVDDQCPNRSGESAERFCRKNCTVIYHKKNQGVGGAVISGYLKALELGCDVIIKMDGDGQMNPSCLGALIAPLIDNIADYTKGNRFSNTDLFKHMPKVRLFGNSILSFIIKWVSGYWHIMDPTNGYTAIHRRVLEKLDLSRISKGYFFETNMLIDLNIIEAVVMDISMPARYNEQKSSLCITKVLLQFPPQLLKGFLKRIFLKYFIYNFNMGSVYILLGIPMFLFGVFYGTWEWMNSAATDQPRSAGTIMLVALPIIISFQMLLQAISIDINNTPKK